jgi:ribonuclease HII
MPDYGIEQELHEEGYRYIVGVDEAGRGPGAGPVVAASVFIPTENVNLLCGKVNDSKKVSSKKRDYLFDLITDSCAYGFQDVEPIVIDEINILEATKLAMKSSIEQLDYFDFILIDGTVDLTNHVICDQRQIIKGDSISVSISAASIIAKVIRDRMMVDLHKIFPIYGWDKNKGYLTKSHIDAINTYGITDFHRKSFKKVCK